MAVGVPLMVTVLDDQLPLTPAGSPLKLAPVAPVVVYVILAIGILMLAVCALVPAAELRVMVLFGVRVTVTALVTVQPLALVKVIVPL